MTVKIEIYFFRYSQVYWCGEFGGKWLGINCTALKYWSWNPPVFPGIFLTSVEIFYAEICNTKYSLLFFKLCYLKPNCKWKLIVWKDLKVQSYVLRCFKYLNQISVYCSINIPFQRFVLQVIKFPSGSWITMEIACILLLYLLLNKIQY